ncbi:MAG: ABC transporter permease [Alphaproteobacteria bacterium]|nr:ABC transporter permease [Alphaproteobacteria bacterium]
MTVYLIRRLMQAGLVLAVMSVLVFLGVFAVGDPIEILISPEATQFEKEEARRALGLDLPLWQQYLVFLENAVQGDLGRSFVFNMPAIQVILMRFPATLELALVAMLWTVLFGVPLGLWAGLKPNSVSGKTIMAGSILGFSLPSFWVGLMLIMTFAVMLGWLPSTGRAEPVTMFGITSSLWTAKGWAHVMLPSINLALGQIALVIRLTRAGVREAMLMDYVKFARAKGLTRRRVIGVHVMKNIMIPIVTVLGLELGSLIAFAVVTESIFAWPGMGKLIIDSINLLDRPIVVAYLMMTVFLVILINFAVDVLYSVLDPRVRLKDSGS